MAGSFRNAFEHVSTYAGKYNKVVFNWALGTYVVSCPTASKLPLALFLVVSLASSSASFFAHLVAACHLACLGDYRQSAFYPFWETFVVVPPVRNFVLVSRL